MASTVKDAIKQVQAHEPDLLFLDIYLPDGDSFEVLEKTSSIRYDVIFLDTGQKKLAEVSSTSQVAET